MPLEQACVSSHQPQPSTWAQSAQLLCCVQLPHELEGPYCHEDGLEHAPDVEPEIAPGRQADSEPHVCQPQPSALAHWLHELI